MGDIDYKKAWLSLKAKVQERMRKNPAWNMVDKTMESIQDESRVNFNLSNVYCPRCACPHVTPILYSCDAEGHIFGQGAWYQTQLIQSQIEILKLRKVITEKHKRLEAKEMRRRLGKELGRTEKVKGRIKKRAAASLKKTVEKYIIKARRQPNADRIIACIEKYPGCTSREISEETGICIKSTTAMLSIMHKKKQIKRLPGDNGRYEYYKWLPGEEKTVENAYKNHAGGGLTGTQRIMAYVGMNPGHNAREIARGTKMPIKNVAPRLTKLRDAHRVSRLGGKGRYK